MEWFLEYGETRLKVVCDKDLRSESLGHLVFLYDQLVHYINRNPLFKSSYEPVEVGNDAPDIVRVMAEAAAQADVGPMASVAGAFSQLVGEFLVGMGASDVVVDNGGDIYLRLDKEKVVRVYAGESPLSGSVSLRVKPGETPVGVCTSSGSVGPSISLGEADAATVVADSAVLADAAASAVGNEVRGPDGIESGFERAGKVSGIRGVIVIACGRVGFWGNLPEMV